MKYTKQECEKLIAFDKKSNTKSLTQEDWDSIHESLFGIIKELELKEALRQPTIRVTHSRKGVCSHKLQKDGTYDPPLPGEKSNVIEPYNAKENNQTPPK